MLPENLKRKKSEYVCDEKWLHPLHPFFRWQISEGRRQKKSGNF
jgi:hypothetical protein